MSLTDAVRAGDRAELERLIRDGADVNELGEAGRTPLIEAAAAGGADLVRVLIDARADPSLTDELQESALPALHHPESRSRQEVQRKLAHATRNCVNAYAKGKRSFEVLGKLSPAELEQHLPSFRRMLRILGEAL